MACICADAPDAVDRINWKCVECDRNLKADCDTKWETKKAEQAAAIVARDATKPGELTTEQIAHRRAMAEN